MTASIGQSEAVIRVLRALVEHFADRPNTLPFDDWSSRGSARHLDVAAGSPQAVREAVSYVAGMTDRYAFTMAIDHLGWDRSSLPIGVDWRR
jgi:dGTPase